MKTHTFDVIVCGGGPSGIGAAFAAADLGKNVAIIERGACLGGLATLSWMAILINRKSYDRYNLAGPVYRDIIGKLYTENMTYGSDAWDVVEIERYKVLLEEMAMEKGITLFYHAEVFKARTDHDAVCEVTALTREGEVSFAADLFVDATGDAYLANAAGCEMEYVANPQPMTGIVRIGGVDVERAKREADGVADMGNGYLILSGMKPYFTKGRKAGTLTFQKEGVSLGWSNPSCPSDIIINGTRVSGCHPLTAEGITRAEIEGRKQARELVETLRRFVPGFETSYLIGTGPEIGVREGRRVVGILRLTRDDILRMNEYDDAVAACAYAIDVHSPDGGSTELIELHQQGKGAYLIPYRACVPKGRKRLLVVGRGASADTPSAGSFRVQPTVMTMGEGAVRYHFTGDAGTLAGYREIPSDIG